MDYSKTRHSLRIILMLAACALLAAGCFQLARPVPPADLKEYMEKEGSTPIVFSCSDGFYSEAVSLELTAPSLLPEGAEIRYTMDGTDPDRDSELYQGPILLRAGENAHEGERERYAYGASADPGSGEADDATASEGAGQDGEAAASPPGADYAADNPAAGTTVFTVRARLFCGEDATDVQYGVYCVGTGLLPFENGYIVCIDTDPEGLYDYDTGILVGGRDLDENNGSKYHGNYMQKGGIKYV